MTIDLLGVLAADRALAEAATEGPWTVVTENCDCYGGCSHGENGGSEFAYAISIPEHQKWGLLDDSGDECKPDDSSDYLHHQRTEISQFTIATAEFIAAARSALPRYVETVQAVLDLHRRAYVTRGATGGLHIIDEPGGTKCIHCHVAYPCMTVVALSRLIPKDGGE